MIYKLLYLYDAIVHKARRVGKLLRVIIKFYISKIFLLLLDDPS